MANSAFIIIEPFPKFDVLDATLKEIVTKRFPTFELVTNDNKSGWILQYSGLPDLSTNLWISKHNKKKAIQIPHRHSYSFLWWIEYEIRERIANHFNAWQYDEGIGKCLNGKEYFATYSDYLRRIYKPRMIEFTVAIAKDEMKSLPKDIVKLHGDLFKRKYKPK